MLTSSLHWFSLDYASELDTYGPVFRLWANSEGELNDDLLSIAEAVEKCAKATRNSVSTFFPPIFHYHYQMCLKLDVLLRSRTSGKSKSNMIHQGVNKFLELMCQFKVCVTSHVPPYTANVVIVSVIHSKTPISSVT